jgi:hypothetical protein
MKKIIGNTGIKNEKKARFFSKIALHIFLS